MELIKKNIQDLIPAAYNPRKDLQPGDPEYEKLKHSLDEFGYVEPVIWNKRTGNVVGGHQRLKVLQREGISEIDCVVIDMDTEKEKALNIALNKISGDWDTDKLALLITDLQGSDFDVSLTGFDPAELDDLFKDDIKNGVHEDDFDVDAELKKPVFPRQVICGSWESIACSAATAPSRKHTSDCCREHRSIWWSLTRHIMSTTKAGPENQE